ncbi:MAG: hypothetical protein E7Z89_06565 [Cyanobacteria bacterium SIG28]|nr:hypothetical protein [Cyanobacteria bacterium SIG28]
MVSVNSQNEKVYLTGGTKINQTAHFPVQNNISKPIEQQNNTTFKSVSYQSAVSVRTELTTRDERKKYNELSEVLDLKHRKMLEYGLKSGILLKNNSDDKSSVLDNLHKILKEERDPGLDGQTVLEECLEIISNPYVITQTCEDIPKEYKTPIIGLITNMSEDKREINRVNFELDNMHTGTCPTASVEFDLATKNPAEFFRIVEGLTSPANEAYKVIDLDALSEKTLDAVWLLNKFKTPHKLVDFNKAVVLLKPDKHAIIRARIQNNHKDKGERSIVDVLMQSTMMQLGSQQTYNSLTDKRAPNAWTQDDGGLIDFEKTYVESVMENKNTVSVIYQKVGNDGRLEGYEKDFATIKKELLDTLAMGHNIIIGYTWPDPDNDNRLAGHEITIVGTKTGKHGETVFICQDSDDDLAKPIEMSEAFLLPKIHHAGLPEEIANRDFQYEESWKVGVNEFNKQKRA